jgi:hypothetical protein
MHRSIQLTKTTSSRRASPVTWPNDNKAIGTRFVARIAGLQPAVFILTLHSIDNSQVVFAPVESGRRLAGQKLHFGPGKRLSSRPTLVTVFANGIPSTEGMWSSRNATAFMERRDSLPVLGGNGEVKGTKPVTQLLRAWGSTAGCRLVQCNK